MRAACVCLVCLHHIPSCFPSLFFIRSDSGIVNVYSTANLQQETPLPLKALKNLTTPVDDVLFNHDSQLLAMSSRLKKDALKLVCLFVFVSVFVCVFIRVCCGLQVHLPSLTVFSNWPTSQTPLHYVSTMDFSPHSGYLAAGNDKGKVLLYRLHHYPTA